MMIFVGINDTFRAAASAAYYTVWSGEAAMHAGVFVQEGIAPGAAAQRAAAEAGLDLSEVRSVALCEEHLQQANQIVAVTASIADHLREDYPAYADKVRSLEVEDPFGMGKQAYLDCLQAIREQVEALR